MRIVNNFVIICSKYDIPQKIFSAGYRIYCILFKRARIFADVIFCGFLRR